jgi:hypothetical protein
MGVHESHCCIEHGCKYGDDDCPVSNGVTKQSYTCESCSFDGIESIDQLRMTRNGVPINSVDLIHNIGDKVWTNYVMGGKTMTGPVTIRGIEIRISEKCVKRSYAVELEGYGLMAVNAEGIYRSKAEAEEALERIES